MTGDHRNSCPRSISFSSIYPSLRFCSQVTFNDPLDNSLNFPCSADNDSSPNNFHAIPASSSSCTAHPPQSACLEIKLLIKGRTTFALLDSGASSSFIDRDYAELLDIPFQELPFSIPVTTIDGSSLKNGDVTLCTVPVLIKSCLGYERLRFFVIKTHSQPIVLGAPWLVKHNPDIDWCGGRVRPRPLRRPVNINAVRSDESCLGFDNPEVLAPEPTEDRRPTEVPKQYCNFVDVSDKAILDKLPPHRPYDCAIELEPGKQPPFGPIYPLSEPEAAALRAFLV